MLPVATFRNHDIDVVRLGLRDDAPEHLQRPNGLKIPKYHLDGALFTGEGDAANVAVVFQALSMACRAASEISALPFRLWTRWPVSSQSVWRCLQV